jgi:type IV pilus biogenesis protein CpaD/CtpE
MTVLARLRQPLGRGLTVAATFVVLGGAGSGCTRAHLTASHGRAYHEVFAAQDANPNRKGAPKSVNGLDSQEASIIAGSYRRALSPKAEGSASANQLLTMSPNRVDPGALAPSVPSGN